MTAGALRSALKVLFWNVHLFGETAMVRKVGSDTLVETVLNFRDMDRAKRLARLLLGLKEEPHVIGLAEVWDPRLRQLLQDRLRAVYPYSFHGPEGVGLGPLFQRIVEAGRELSEKNKFGLGPQDFDPERLMSLFVARRYDTNLLARGARRLLLPSDDTFASLVAADFRDQTLLGAGLLFFSKTPFLWDPRFLPHPVRVEAGRLAMQGGIQAVVASPSTGRPVYLFVTHLAEGVSKEARRARTAQWTEHLKTLETAADQDLIYMGDLNITGEAIRRWGRGFGPIREYRRMRDHLRPRLSDTYRSLHHDPQLEPGWTFDDRNPISAQKGIRPPPGGGAMRIDYIFHSRGLDPRDCRVLRNEIPSGEDALSDHFPLYAEFG